MARYIDADALKKRMLSYYDCVNENTAKENYRGETLMNYEVADMIEDCIDNAPAADVVERSECKKWYHEYHKIKENFKQEKEYHRSTEKLSDKYHTELQAAKAEVKRLDFDLDVEKMRRMADRERYEDRIRDIFGMLEMLMKKRVFPVVREGVIEVERDPFLAIDPQDYTRIKGMYIDGQSGTPVPTGETEEVSLSDG